MKIRELHSWQVTPKEAAAIQNDLRNRVSLVDGKEDISLVAGVDVGIDRQRLQARAAVVVLRLPELEVVERVAAVQPVQFPYVPGLLSFREMPVIIAALRELTVTPDLFICDGQGIAHPRRFGLACHLGLVTNTPAIGAAKTRLCGSHGVVPTARGEWTPLVDGDQQIGAVLRTRAGVKPLFVSPGHRVSLLQSVGWVMRAIGRYRLPETTREAHRHAQCSAGQHHSGEG